MKQCSKCKQLKPKSEFSKDKKAADGLYYQCKECKKQYNKKYREANREQISEQQRQYAKQYYSTNRISNPEKLMWQAAKKRAKKRGLEFNIKVTDIVIPEFCPVLGLKLELGEGNRQDNSPSLDRIDSSKGYIKGNVEVISWKANRLKNDATIEELEKITAYYRSNA